jgi:hypothetical protein
MKLLGDESQQDCSESSSGNNAADCSYDAAK